MNHDTAMGVLHGCGMPQTVINKFCLVMILSRKANLLGVCMVDPGPFAVRLTIFIEGSFES